MLDGMFPTKPSSPELKSNPWLGVPLTAKDMCRGFMTDYQVGSHCSYMWVRKLVSSRYPVLGENPKEREALLVKLETELLKEFVAKGLEDLTGADRPPTSLCFYNDNTSNSLDVIAECINKVAESNGLMVPPKQKEASHGNADDAKQS